MRCGYPRPPLPLLPKRVDVEKLSSVSPSPISSNCRCVWGFQLGVTLQMTAPWPLALNRSQAQRAHESAALSRRIRLVWSRACARSPGLRGRGLCLCVSFSFSFSRSRSLPLPSLSRSLPLVAALGFGFGALGGYCIVVVHATLPASRILFCLQHAWFRHVAKISASSMASCGCRFVAYKPL